MLRTIAIALFLLFLVPRGLANDYQDAWKAINAKDFKSAKAALLKATRHPATSMDAYLTMLYLQTYQGNETQIDGFLDAVAGNPDKNSYTYALWFNGSMLGPYGKKAPYQINFIDKLLSDNSFNGTINAAAHYVKGIHLLSSGDFSGMKKECDAINAIVDWQLAGPFENISGSGFNNNNGPITIVDKTPFKGANNVNINWFTPVAMDRHGWTSTFSHIPQSTAIVYAQAFVNAPEDMKVILNAGSCGSIKVWINDGLVLAEAAEKQTELDYYNNYCSLKKGYNRILVQLGYSGNTTPNFIVRFSDENAFPIKTLSYSSEVQPYAKATDAASTKSLKQFAEKFFEEKIAADPTNLINYVLLCETYLRNERTTESRQVIEKALQILPNNPLLKFELVQCLNKSGNRTSMLQELEWLKENDPDSYVNLTLKTNDLVSEQKYDEAYQYLTKMKELYGEDVNIMIKEINVLANQQKTEPTLQLIKQAYEKYPDNARVAIIMFQVKKDVEKNSKAAVEVLQKFLKNNYNYDVYNKLMEEYRSQGEQVKYVEMLKNLYDHFNYEAKYASYLTSYYFDKQNYQKAREYAELELKLSPFTGIHWQNLGFTQEALKKTDDAINSFRKAIYYDRTNYEVRKKLSSLENKTELYNLLPNEDAYELIKKAPSESNYNFNYLMDERGTIIYDEGASEQYFHYAVKIFNQKGIDSWKEINLGYDENWQNLFVETIEVVKMNGSKVPAERDGSQVVFTGLEPGDAIHVKYRIQNYWTGRLGREFWDTYNFDGFVPSQNSKYTLIVPKDYNFNSTVQNDKIVPAVHEVDGYKVYTWAIQEEKALESEPFMPAFNDVGKVLHVSTLKSWNEVANWYSDLSYQDLKNNYELDAAFKEIFPKGTPASNFEKARIIYNYILTNIRYSSVSFRQSAMVPQNVSKTLSTRLGDCKDVASLFVALAGKAGIPAQLVLVNTRDNGTKGLVLPSMEFNHCIAMAKINGKDYYVELTNSNLPFGSLPNDVNGALSLLIPVHGEVATEGLKPIVATNRTKDISARDVNVEIEGKDLKLTMNVLKTGSLVTSFRDDYATLPDTKQKEIFQQSISGGYKNPVKLESLLFKNLNNLSDSLSIRYSFSVKNEVIEAGSMKMIKVPFADIVATIDNFSADKREFPIEYWTYENTDEYHTTVHIQLPKGEKFLEIPADVDLNFKGSTYKIHYKKDGNQLIVTRIAKLNKDNIAPADYSKFKTFFNAIVEAESKYVVFK